MDKKWCVYVHISPSNKYYVGITSQKPTNRWRSGKGYRSNRYFSNAIEKYGWENIQHEVVASNLTETEAKNFEKILIQKLRSNNAEFGYNITAGGDGTVGVSHYGNTNPFYGKRHTEEAKKKMSEFHKGCTGELNHFFGKHHSEDTKLLLSTTKGYAVCQFDTDFNFIKEFRSVNHAADETGLFPSTILGCCNKDSGYVTSGGFTWMYKKDVSPANIEEYRRRLLHDKLPKAVCKFTQNMEYIEAYSSIADAARTCALASPDISNAIRGKRATAGGFIWIALAEYEKMLSGEIPMREPPINSCWKEVYKYSIKGELIEKYPNKVLAGESVGVSPQAIGSACKSKSHKCKGYIWRFVSDVEVA